MSNPRAFWDPTANGTVYIDDGSGDNSIRFIYRGTSMSLQELVDRLVKVEDALADYIILGDGENNG